jgi:predicted lactoylglutathione lyase
MKPATVVLSLPVADLDRSLAFYRDGIGLDTDGVDDGVIAFELPNLSLFLIEQGQFAGYTGAAVKTPVAGACILSCAIGTRAEVDDVLARAAAAGGKVGAEPAEEGGSYTGYFADPDGHVWELVYNDRTRAAANG